MSSFSYSAPVFSEEDRRRELALLSEEELEQIHQDVKNPEEFEESHDQRESGLAQMEEIIDDIPLEEKIDYTRAMIECPEIVKRESPMLLFLRKNRYNAMVRYITFKRVPVL